MATRIVCAVLYDDAPLPTLTDLAAYSMVDLASALSSATTAYVRRAEAAIANNIVIMSQKRAAPANRRMEAELATWKPLAESTVLDISTSDSTDMLIGVLVLCLDAIKDLEWEMLDE